MSYELKRKLWSYYIVSALGNSGLSFMIATYILFLLKIGLSFFEIGLVNIACVVGGMLCDSWTGAIADKIGRKTAFLIGNLVVAVSILPYYYARSFWPVLALEVVAGIGFAIQSGTLGSYIIDEMRANGYSDQDGRVLSISEIASSITSMVFGAVGAYIGRNDIGLPFFACGVGAVTAGLAGFFLLHENAFKKEAKESVWKMTLEGFAHVKNEKRLAFVAAFFFVVAFADQIFVKMWTPLVKMHTDQANFVWIAPLMMAGKFVGGIVGARTKKEKYFISSLVFQLCSSVAMFLCAALSGIHEIIGMLLVIEFAYGTRVLIAAEANKYMDSHRATLNSVLNTIVHLGTVLGLLAGLLADKTSIQLTWIVGGTTSFVFLLAVGLKYLRLVKKSSVKN